MTKGSQPWPMAPKLMPLLIVLTLWSNAKPPGVQFGYCMRFPGEGLADLPSLPPLLCLPACFGLGLPPLPIF